MWHCVNIHWITGFCLALTVSLGSLPAVSHATAPSSLSRWLDREALVEIREILAQHPRFARQRLQVVGGEADALSAAIATVLIGKLVQDEHIRVVVPGPAAAPVQPLPVSVDELDCRSEPGSDYQLQVVVRRMEAGRDRVQLLLLEAAAGGEQLRSWQWTGRFSADERRQAKKPAGPVIADGSLNAPWGERDVDVAALSLSRGFACALRPRIVSRLDLQWPGQTLLPPLLADTANASRHLLGNYRELGITDGQAAYSVGFRMERFRHDIWQLWMIGSPRQAGLAPVQAVAYFRAGAPDFPKVIGGTAVAKQPLPVPPPDLGKALDFIDVEVLDATQTDHGRARADLQVTLRIGNRADWPITYSFTLSGGHFDHCIARSGYYRHDRYGSVSGSVEPGDSVVRRLVIEKTQHRPLPWFGTRKCAGFRDLDGFEQFASQGHKVTDFVRWDM